MPRRNLVLAGSVPWKILRNPPESSGEINSSVISVTHGREVVPVRAKVGKTKRANSHCPMDGPFCLPSRPPVRRAEILSVDGEGKVRPYEVLQLGMIGAYWMIHF